MPIGLIEGRQPRIWPKAIREKGDMPDKVFRLSHFKINTFRQCPRRYRYQYVDGLYGLYHRPRPYHTMGEHVHGVLKSLLYRSNQERTSATAERLLRQRWPSNRGGFETRDEEREYFERALAQVRWFCQTQDLTAQPYVLEAQHEIPLSPALRVLGKIDRVDRYADGSFHVIDYKTSRTVDNDDDLQLLTYALILSRKFGAEIRRASYLFLNGAGWRTIEPGVTDLEETEDALIAAWREITAETEFAPKPNRFCRWCDFVDICDASRKQPSSDTSMEPDGESSFEGW